MARLLEPAPLHPELAAEIEARQAAVVRELARMTGVTPEQIRRDVALRALARIRQMDHAARSR